MPSDSHPYLWNILSAGCFFFFIYIYHYILGLTSGTWRAAMNETGIVASVHMIKDTSSNKITCQQVMSSMHTGTVSIFIFIFTFILIKSQYH